MDVSAERLPELDADFVLQPGAVTPVVNLRMSWQQWKSHAGMVSVSDGLSFRALCADSREEAISNSFASLGLMAAQINHKLRDDLYRRLNDPERQNGVDIYGERFRTRASQLTPGLELSQATLMSIVKWYSSKRR